MSARVKSLRVLASLMSRSSEAASVSSCGGWSTRRSPWARLTAELVGKCREIAGQTAFDGRVLMTVAQTPMLSTVELSARVDIELVRLDERRTALHLAASAYAKNG